MFRLSLLYLLLVFTICLCACTKPRQTILDRAMQADFAQYLFDTTDFTLYGLLRAGKGDILHVYIEGDGHAWINKNQPSSDPTPNNPIALSLALNDNSTAPILYLARPCQFVSGKSKRNCTGKKAVQYWTSARLGKQVIQSLSEAIDQAKITTMANKVIIVGFSGGGGAAALLAARRTDVLFLGSVAGNLDIKAWTDLHKVSPLSDSFNPIDSASQLQTIAQRHLSSTDDSIIPPEISHNFCNAVKKVEACRTIQGIPHTGPWEKYWIYEYNSAF